MKKYLPIAYHKSGEGFYVYFASVQAVNEALKEIGEEIGFDKEYTTFVVKLPEGRTEFFIEDRIFQFKSKKWIVKTIMELAKERNYEFAIMKEE